MWHSQWKEGMSTHTNVCWQLGVHFSGWSSVVMHTCWMLMASVINPNPVLLLQQQQQPQLQQQDNSRSFPWALWVMMCSCSCCSFCTVAISLSCHRIMSPGFARRRAAGIPIAALQSNSGLKLWMLLNSLVLTSFLPSHRSVSFSWSAQWLNLTTLWRFMQFLDLLVFKQVELLDFCVCRST